MSRKMSNEKLYAKLTAAFNKVCDADKSLAELHAGMPVKMIDPCLNAQDTIRESAALVQEMINTVKAVLDYQAKMLGAETSERDEGTEQETKAAAE